MKFIYHLTIITVKYSLTNIYLGATITDDGNYLTSMDCHTKRKMKQVLK